MTELSPPALGGNFAHEEIVDTIDAKDGEYAMLTHAQGTGRHAFLKNVPQFLMAASKYQYLGSGFGCAPLNLHQLCMPVSFALLCNQLCMPSMLCTVACPSCRALYQLCMPVSFVPTVAAHPRSRPAQLPPGPFGTARAVR